MTIEYKRECWYCHGRSKETCPTGGFEEACANSLAQFGISTEDYLPLYICGQCAAVSLAQIEVGYKMGQGQRPWWYPKEA